MCKHANNWRVQAPLLCKGDSVQKVVAREPLKQEVNAHQFEKVTETQTSRR